MFLFLGIFSSFSYWEEIDKHAHRALNFFFFFSHIICYSVIDVMKKLQEYVDDINNHIERLESRGPVSKYVLPDEDLRGRCAFFFFYMN